MSPRKNEPTLEDKLLMDAIGTTLASLRHKCDFTVAHASAAVGLTHGAVSNIEHGRQWPPIPTLRRFCRLYGVGLTEFFKLVEKNL